MKFMKTMKAMAGKGSVLKKSPAFSKIYSLSGLLLAVLVAGCGSGTAVQSSTSSSGSQSYFAVAVAGSYGGGSGSSSQTLATYTLNDTQQTFDQKTYELGASSSVPQLNYSGGMSVLSRGLLSLDITYYCGVYAENSFNCSDSNATTPNPPITDSWAVELAGQAGGLVNLKGLAATPLVAAQTCPDYATAKTFLFVTIPGALVGGNKVEGTLTWNPTYDTAYGSVDVSTSGSTVNFSNIKQFAISGSQVTSYPTLAGDPSAYSTIAGVCAPSFYGNTVSVPASVTITDPGVNETVTPQALVGIGPSDLLLESNGAVQGAATVPIYQPFLGAGTGAIGLPKPSKPLDTGSDTGSLTSAQYLGFFYGSGNSSNGSNTGWTSPVASFGFPSLPSTCPVAIANQTSTMINGGDYLSNNPGSAAVQANGGYPTGANGAYLCDVTIDLGTQDSSNNGLFLNAKVYVGTEFSAYTANQANPYSAVAIAGQLDGKYAIFLIGADTPNLIYLLQSN